MISIYEILEAIDSAHKRHYEVFVLIVPAAKEALAQSSLSMGQIHESVKAAAEKKLRECLLS